MLLLPPVIGHRGAAGLAPENSLAAFAKAAEWGCAMVECDVRLSADAIPVVFHDDDLDRCTSGQGPVAAQTADQLRRLGVATLAEVLAFCVRAGLGINIEIKPDRGAEAATARAALELAGRLWPTDRPPPLVSSFRRAALAQAGAVAPHWPRGLLYTRLPAGWRRHAETLGCSSVHLDHRWLTPMRVGPLRDAGLAVAGYTVNSRARAEKLWNIGVLAVFSDRPDLLGRA